MLLFFLLENSAVIFISNNGGSCISLSFCSSAIKGYFFFFTFMFLCLMDFDYFCWINYGVKLMNFMILLIEFQDLDKKFQSFVCFSNNVGAPLCVFSGFDFMMLKDLIFIQSKTRNLKTCVVKLNFFPHSITRRIEYQ